MKKSEKNLTNNTIWVIIKENIFEDLKKVLDIANKNFTVIKNIDIKLTNVYSDEIVVTIDVENSVEDVIIQYDKVTTDILNEKIKDKIILSFNIVG